MRSVLAAALIAAAVPAAAMQQPAPAAAASVSDADVVKFAKFLVKRWELQNQGKGEDQIALLDAVNSVGLNGASYNAISTAMAADPAVNARIQAAYQKEIAARPAAEIGGAPAQNPPQPSS